MTRGPAGQRLVDAVLGKYELAAHEAVLLDQAAIIADRLAELQELVEADGLYLDDGEHLSRVNPAAVEQRQLWLTLARMLAALRLPVEDDVGELRRPTGPRGVYDGGGRR